MNVLQFVLGAKNKMAKLNNPYSAGVFLSFFVNDFEKRNFKIPNGNKMRHNPQNNKRTKSKRGKK